MSNLSRPRQRLRMRSGRANGFDSGSSLSCLGSLGVVESAVALDSECTLEGCECQHHLAELAKSFEILSHEAFTVGELTITPLRRR